MTIAITDQHIPPNVKNFFDTFIMNQSVNENLILTVKSSPGASVNIDGPFRFNVFRFNSGQEFLVIEPMYAKVRAGGAETDVHVHVPWHDIASVSIERWPAGGRPSITIDHNIRIAFYSSTSDELIFWFYAHEDRMSELCNIYPVDSGRHALPSE
jgi:hypothetical protein